MKHIILIALLGVFLFGLCVTKATAQLQVQIQPPPPEWQKPTSQPKSSYHTVYVPINLEGFVRRYRLTDLGPASQDYDSIALNNRGQLALTVEGVPQLWRNGVRQRLPGMSGYSQTEVSAINDRGDCVGSVSYSGSGAYSFRYGDAVLWHGGKIVSLGSLNGLSDASASAINNDGVIVGNSATASIMEANNQPQTGPVETDVSRGFVWKSGKMAVIDGGPVAINDAGDIAGDISAVVTSGGSYTQSSHAARYSRHKWRDLGAPSGYTYSSASGINARGWIVGNAYKTFNQSDPEAVLWHDGINYDLGPGHAFAINSVGDIVGDSGGAAVLWHGSQLVDLNRCMRFRYKRNSWHLTSAVAINNRGQIAGYGTCNRVAHAFLLTPVTDVRAARSRVRQTSARPLLETASMRLVAAATGADRITLYWRSIPGAATYQVYRAETGSPERASRVDSGKDAPARDRNVGAWANWTYTIRGLRDKTAYQFYVVAVDSGHSEMVRSDPATATTDARATPWDTCDPRAIANAIWGRMDDGMDEVEVEIGDGQPVMPPTSDDFTCPDGAVFTDPGPNYPASPYQYNPHAAIRFHAVELSTVDNAVIQILGMNNNGDVVGAAMQGIGRIVATPLIWHNGTLHCLDIGPGGSYAFAAAVNDSGVICGYGNDAQRHSVALVWMNGSVISLPAPAGLHAPSAYAISNSGEIAGTANASDGTVHGVIWDAQLHPADVGPIGGMGRLRGINDTGIATGVACLPSNPDEFRAIIATAGKPIVYLGTLNGGHFGHGAAINQRGHIAGFVNFPRGTNHACLFEDGKVIDLGIVPNGSGSRANALNDADMVVGMAGINGRLVHHAVLWQNGEFVDLNNQLDAPIGDDLVDAVGINNRGDIIAVSAGGLSRRAFVLQRINP